jgi:hypothetical protein
MARLKMAQRRALARSSFAIPSKAPGSGSYPIPDRGHAISALSRVAQHGTSAEQAQVRAKVRARFPALGKGNAARRALAK